MIDESLEYELVAIEFEVTYDIVDLSALLACEDAEDKYVESNNSIEYDADGIPMGNSTEDLRIRKQLIFQFYEKWKNEHPQKSVFNESLKSEILIRKESVVEAADHASKRYKSTLAVMRLDEVLSKAIKVSTDAPKRGNKNQEKLVQIILMSYRCPDLGTVKLTVGVRRRSADKIQYGITVLREGETITSLGRSNKTKHPTKK